MDRDGKSPRNIRRIIAKRVRENLTRAKNIPAISNNLVNLDICDSVVEDSDSGSNISNNDRSSNVIHNSDEPLVSDSLSDNGVVENNRNILDLTRDLRDWSLRHNITGVALNDLLRIFNFYQEFRFLPLDSRTLLKNSIKYSMKTIGQGQYAHFDVIQNIKRQIDSNCILASGSEIKLNLIFSFDGLPISKSNSNQFWPIQAKCEESTYGVFVVGLFYGKTKPESIDEYLMDLIAELKSLRVGISYNNLKIFCKVSKIIADAPARSFLKQCKSHNAYNGCEKCIDPGFWKGRVIFRTFDSPLRTDQDFYVQKDKHHHVGISPFTELKILMISSVPLDYMHLICLGVVRKLLRSWVKGPLPFKLSSRDISTLSSKLVLFSHSCPKEFCRKPRSVKELDMWKATEFRTFLLYTGPVALKGLLSPKKYTHFLNLCVAVTILITTKAQANNWNDYARQLLLKFVKNVPNLYEEEFLSYNMHSLIHISDDALKHGPLDSFSAFDFENNMQVIKRSLRAHYKPFEQTVNRTAERENHKYQSPVNLNRHCIIKSNGKDHCFILKDGKVVVISSISKDKKHINCRKFKHSDNLFTCPCESKILGIIKVSKLSNSVTIIGINDIDKKCWLLPSDKIDENICIPLYNVTI